MIAVATKTVECLRFTPETARAAEALQALATGAVAAGLGLSTTAAYTGGADWLLLWGPGAPNRFDPMCKQLRRGGHVLALDGAYWQRDRKFRISIDGAHPQQWVMRRPLPPSRVEADGLIMTDLWDQDGPVVVAGLGAKAAVQYGQAVADWEAEQVALVRAAGRRVLYRAKPGGAWMPGVERIAPGPINVALRGASAVITWHSNVAVDAIRLGIPVVCRDGAAAAICSSSWSPILRPLSIAWRDRFLANLAWFQWAPDEATSCWAFLREALA